MLVERLAIAAVEKATLGYGPAGKPRRLSVSVEFDSRGHFFFKIPIAP